MSSSELRLRDLLGLWGQYSGPSAAGPAIAYLAIGQRMLKAGEPLLADDILRGGLALARGRQVAPAISARPGTQRCPGGSG